MCPNPQSLPGLTCLQCSLPDDDWQEEHARLAELDERVRDGGVSIPPTVAPAAAASSPQPSAPPPGLEERGGGDLAESLARLILGTDPAIAGVGAAGLPERAELPPQRKTLSEALPARPPPLLGYQQQQQQLRMGTAPLQVSCDTALICSDDLNMVWESITGLKKCFHGHLAVLLSKDLHN